MAAVPSYSEEGPFEDASLFIGAIEHAIDDWRINSQQFAVPQTPPGYHSAVFREEIVFPQLLGGYLFRGHSNSHWPLVPSVFRPGALHAVHDGLPDRFTWQDPYWFRLFVQCEFDVLRTFAWMGQHIGLDTAYRVGVFDNLFRALSNSISNNNIANYLDQVCDIDNHYFSDILEAMAVAQHHGIPTRLLDWTEDPLAAAYFASSAFSSQDNDLAIFALDTASLFFSNSGKPPLHDHIALVRAPRSRDTFILRQRGVFTLFRGALSKYLANDFDMVSFISRMENHNQRPMLRKFVLDKGSIKDLRRKLFRRGYQCHTVYPALSNVRNTILETSELFGRGRHQYVNWQEGSRVRFVAVNGRFVIKDKPGNESG